MPIDLLATVAEPERSRVLEACHTRTFTRGTVLFHEGDVGDCLHIVESGRLLVRTSTESGDVVTLDVVGPGAVVGEIALVIASHRRSATVVALDDCSTRMLTVAAFDALCRVHPGVSSTVTRLMAERIERLTQHLCEALYVGVDQRVARRIRRAADLYGGADVGTVVPLTQQDLADLAGATRPTVNQSLKKLEAAGAVTVFRGGVRIADVDELDRHCRPSPRPPTG